MDDIVHFITTHYELIINCLIAIVSIVFFILRKRNNNVLVDTSSMNVLVSYVLEAEEKFGSGHGKDKLAFVVGKYLAHLNYAIDDHDWLVKAIVQKVEMILSTPQKKK